MTCVNCKRNDGSMAFECIECCVRWLSKMDRDQLRVNAPVIERVMGAEFMEKVRQAYKVRKK